VIKVVSGIVPKTENAVCNYITIERKSTKMKIRPDGNKIIADESEVSGWHAHKKSV
jgi:hypothetical protein